MYIQTWKILNNLAHNLVYILVDVIAQPSLKSHATLQYKRGQGILISPPIIPSAHSLAICPEANWSIGFFHILGLLKLEHLELAMKKS